MLSTRGLTWQVHHGAQLTFGTTVFDVVQERLVICASSVSGDDKKQLKANCIAIGAELVKEWRDDVTHLIMLEEGWTPKFLTALGALVPVISPAWVQAAAARSSPIDPLPDAQDARFAPRPASGAAAGRIGAVDARRASLFRGYRIVCLPPAAPSNGSARLLAQMGAELFEWTAPEEGEAATSFAMARAAEGDAFLLPDEPDREFSAAVIAARATGAEIISPLQVRTTLVYADLDRGLGAAMTQADDAGVLTQAGASQSMASQVVATQRRATQAATQAAASPTIFASQAATSHADEAVPCSALPSANVLLPTHSTKAHSTKAHPPNAHPTNAHPPNTHPPNVGCDDGFQPSRRKQAAVTAAATAAGGAPAPAATATAATIPQLPPSAPAVASAKKAKKATVPSAASDTSQSAAEQGGSRTTATAASGFVPPGEAIISESELGATGAQCPQLPTAPAPPAAPREMMLPGGWRRRAHCMLDDGGGIDGGEDGTRPAGASAPEVAIPTTTRDTGGGKRFRKACGRGPGAVVRVRMEAVVTGLDGSGDANADEAPEANDELFEEALLHGRAPTTGRRTRR